MSKPTRSVACVWPKKHIQVNFSDRARVERWTDDTNGTVMVLDQECTLSYCRQHINWSTVTTRMCPVDEQMNPLGYGQEYSNVDLLMLTRAMINDPAWIRHISVPYVMHAKGVVRKINTS